MKTKLDSKLLKSIDNYLRKNYKGYKTEKVEIFRDGPIKKCERSLDDIEKKPQLFGSYKTAIVPEELNDYLKNKDESFSEMLFRIIDDKGLKDSECYKKANIDRKLFSKLRNNEYRPSKSTVILLALALELPLRETKSLLKKAGFALSDSNMSDMIVKYYISKKNYNISLIDETLLQYDQKTLVNY